MKKLFRQETVLAFVFPYDVGHENIHAYLIFISKIKIYTQSFCDISHSKNVVRL